MSLWTPGGEHEVPREPEATQHDGADRPSGTSPSDFDEEKLAAALGIPSLDELSDEERQQLEEALVSMAETERQLATTPANLVVANHAMGIYELAAIHLRQAEPNLAEASLAIDALSAILDKLKGRLGENEATLEQARVQLQQAFVTVKAAAVEGATASDADEAE